MGRKKRDMTCLRPFCFYCDKDFKNEVILHHHQKAKHFKCPKCPKKFSSIDSMVQHCRSQHQHVVEQVPNAMSGRDHPGMRIFGMQGVPRIEIQSWISKQVNKYWGKLMDRKIEIYKKTIEQKQKQQVLLAQRRQQNKDEAMQIEQEEDLDFPLELKFD